MVFSEGDTQKLAAKYLYNNSGEVIGFQWVSGSDAQPSYYYLKNLQGDITGIVNSSGKMQISYSYDVFGKRTTKHHADSSTMAGIAEMMNQMFIMIINPFGYRGYCYDDYTGLYYLQSRYYDPNTGRFINADDTNYLNVTGTVLGCNLFAYCENDAVNRVDETGTISVAFSMVIGAALGVLGLYIMDVLFNLMEGKIKWYKRYSSTVNYISAAVSGALSMISIKKLSSLLSGAVSGVTYLLDQWTAGKKVSMVSFVTTIGIAIAMDIAFPGDGIDLSKRVGIIKTAKQKLKTLVSKVRIKQYINKIKTNIAMMIKNAFYTLLINIITYTAERMEILKATNQFYAYLKKVIKI